MIPKRKAAPGAEERPEARQVTHGDQLATWRSYIGDLIASAAFGADGYVAQIVRRKGPLSSLHEASARRRAHALREELERDFPCQNAPGEYRRNMRWQTAIADPAAIIRYESSSLIPKRPGDFIQAERERRSGITEEQRVKNAEAVAAGLGAP